MIATVSWGPHPKSAAFGGRLSQLPAAHRQDKGQGTLIGFTADQSGHPAGVIVVDEKTFVTVRLSELKFEDWPKALPPAPVSGAEKPK